MGVDNEFVLLAKKKLYFLKHLNSFVFLRAKYISKCSSVTLRMWITLQSTNAYCFSIHFVEIQKKNKTKP